MSVVVNEFEVVPGEDPPGTTTPAPGPQPPIPLAADEVERALRRLCERAARLRAD